MTSDITDDEGTLSVALYEVESVRDDIKRLEGERKVNVTQFTQEIFRRIRCFHGGIVVLVKRDAVCCRQFILLAIGLKIGFLDDAEPIILMAVIAETDGSTVGIGINFPDGQISRYNKVWHRCRSICC